LFVACSIRSTIDRYKKACSDHSSTATTTEINAQVTKLHIDLVWIVWIDSVLFIYHFKTLNEFNNLAVLSARICKAETTNTDAAKF